MGAVDVVPFIPIDGVTMAECVALAKRFAPTVAAALRRARVPLRRGLDQPGAQEPRRHPPRRVRRAGGEDGHSRHGRRTSARRRRTRRAGASVIGARMPLIAYNINLATNRLDVAKKIAAAIRHEQRRPALRQGDGHSARGPRHRAGVDEPHQLREDADLPRLRAGQARGRALRRDACSRAKSSAWCRPAALRQSAEFYLQLEGFSGDQVLENKLSCDDARL